MHLEPFSNLVFGVQGGYTRSNSRTAQTSELRHETESQFERSIRAWRNVTASYLRQQHTNRVVVADARRRPVADAFWTVESDLALVIQTADCVPVFVATHDGRMVGAAHCGWRGLANELLANLIAAMQLPANAWSAWLGPAICQACYEVEQDVLDAFGFDERSVPVETGVQPGKYQLDLLGIAATQLNDLGAESVWNSSCCTYHMSGFHSYRRDGSKGRVLSYVVRANDDKY